LFPAFSLWPQLTYRLLSTFSPLISFNWAYRWCWERGAEKPNREIAIRLWVASKRIFKVSRRLLSLYEFPTQIWCLTNCLHCASADVIEFCFGYFPPLLVRDTTYLTFAEWGLCLKSSW
jgi:hypothetical protein